MAEFLAFHVPEIGEEEIEAVVDVLRSGWLTTGSKAKQFEHDFAAMVGARHAIAVNSCTAALHLALEAIGVQRRRRSHRSDDDLCSDGRGGDLLQGQAGTGGLCRGHSQY